MLLSRGSGQFCILRCLTGCTNASKQLNLFSGEGSTEKGKKKRNRVGMHNSPAHYVHFKPDFNAMWPCGYFSMFPVKFCHQ